MSTQRFLSQLATLGGVVESELSATGQLQPKEVWLLGLLLLSGHAAHVIASVDVVGASGREMLEHWVQEADLGGWGLAAVEPVRDVATSDLAPIGLPKFGRMELRKTLELSLREFLDPTRARLLARLGYVRMADWNSAELEQELASDVPFSAALHGRIASWFVSGLAHQTAQLIEGLGILRSLYTEPFMAAPSPSAVLTELLRVSEVTYGCLKSAAPLAKNMDAIESFRATVQRPLMALLAIRVTDWIFRRVEAERPTVVLRIDWRLFATQLLWTFFSSRGSLKGSPQEVIQTFVLQVVLPTCQRKQTEGSQGHVATDASVVHEDESSLPSKSGFAPAASKDSASDVSPLPKHESQKKRRGKRNVRKETDDVNFDALPTERLASTAQEEEPDSTSLREWSRLSVGLMLQMGWRADSGIPLSPRSMPKSVCVASSQTD